MGSTVDPAEAQGDHIYPKAEGGDGATVDDLKNIETICASCNNKKSDKIE
jgi:5-methylcytosine-specific restriction endonuclease McrA